MRFSMSNKVLVSTVISLSIGSHSFAQGVFTRTDNAAVATRTEVSTSVSIPDFDESDVDLLAQQLLADVSSEANSAFGGASAHSQAASSAMNLTPSLQTTSAPTVDTTVTIDLIANTSAGENEGASALATTTNLRANSSGVFELDAPNDASQATFHGFLYLVAAGGNTTIPTVSVPGERESVISLNVNLLSTIAVAGVGDFTVSADWSAENQNWMIVANLDGMVVNSSASTVNNLFTFSVPVSDGAEIGFGASILSTFNSARAFAANENTAQTLVDWDLSASAWGYATPLGEEPLPGDFDGDGDVDDDDFFIFADNQPADMGATGPEGDADLDGDIDSVDLSIWLANTSSPGIPADFDSDGDVDGTDFLFWQRGYEIASNALVSDGDADRDGDVDKTDLSIWTNLYGIQASVSPQTGSRGMESIPEPTMAMLLFIGCVTSSVCCRSFAVTSTGQSM